MKKKTFVGGAMVALAVTLTAGSLLASNMGFKLNYGLNNTQVGTSKSGRNYLALPDNRQSGIVDSKTLMDDIVFANVADVSKFLKASDSFQSYTGRKSSPGANFTLTAGESVVVRLSTVAPLSVSYIVVGSDDPSLAYTFNNTAVGVSKSGRNHFAYNYHQTAADSKQLMDDIGFANVADVAKFLKASDSFQSYTGRKSSPGANFTLTPGEGYVVRLSTVAPLTVNYTPSHY